MGLSDILRNGIALADSITADLQPAVTHAAWTGQDGYGAATYAAAVSRAAIVEQRMAQVRLQLTGQLVMTRAKVTFLRPIAANGAAGRVEPIDTRDRITLPDGTTGPIVNVASFIDRATGAGYLHEVWLGE